MKRITRSIKAWMFARRIGRLSQKFDEIEDPAERLVFLQEHMGKNGYDAFQQRHIFDNIGWVWWEDTYVPYIGIAVAYLVVFVVYFHCLPDAADRFFMGRGSIGQCLYLDLNTNEVYEGNTR